MTCYEAEPYHSDEKTFLKELALLKSIKSAVTVTLLTLDTPIEADKTLLDQLGLKPDGWKMVSSTGDWRIENFLDDFNQVFKEDFLSYIQNNKESLRLGGSVLTTLKSLLEKRPKITRGVCFAPVGETKGMNPEVSALIDYVNQERQKLVVDWEEQLSGRLVIKNISSPGLTPICVSFFNPRTGDRSMVLIKDEQKIKVPGQTTEDQGPRLVLADIRDFIQPSFFDATVEFAAQPNTFTVIGLGTELIFPEAIDNIKDLLEKAQGEVAFSGNKGEVDALVSCWDGVSSPVELIKAANLRFLLETNGQEGATLYLRLEDDVYSANYLLSPEEIFEGDTTNAGDIFLAGVLAGLMEQTFQEGYVGTSLSEVLKNTSKETFDFLQSRKRRLSF